MSASPRRFASVTDAVQEEFNGRTNFWLVRPEVVEARDLQVCRATLPPGKGHDFHTHPELEEVIYVLEGRLEQWVEKESRVIGPGEVAHIPKGVVHASFNPGPGDAVFLAILSPASCAGPFAVDVSAEEPWKSIRSR